MANTLLSQLGSLLGVPQQGQGLQPQATYSSPSQLQAALQGQQEAAHQHREWVHQQLVQHQSAQQMGHWTTVTTTGTSFVVEEEKRASGGIDSIPRPKPMIVDEGVLGLLDKILKKDGKKG